MKLFATACCLLSLAACQPYAPPAEDASTELRPHIEKVLAAWSSLDTAKVAPYYAKEADLMFFDVSPFQYKGWAAYEEGFRKTSAEWQSASITVGPEFKATRHGNLAWAVYTFNFSGTLKNGTKMDGPARATEILEKRGNDWVIVHEHVSMPMPEAPPPAAPAEKKK